MKRLTIFSAITFACIYTFLTAALNLHAATNDKTCNRKVNKYVFSQPTMTADIFDSLAAYDRFPYLTLRSVHDRKLELSHRSITHLDFDKISGVYIAPDEKPIYIVDVPDSILQLYDLTAGSSEVSLFRDSLCSGDIDIYPWGYMAYMSMRDSDMSLSLGFNGTSITDNPILARQFEWIDSSYTAIANKNSTHQQNLEKYIQHLFDAKKQGMGNDVRVNAQRDTIFSTLNYMIPEATTDSVFSLPLLVFDHTTPRGCTISRLCDSIAANNIFNQLWISQPDNLKNPEKILVAYDMLALHNRESINGVILNSTGDVPIFVSIAPEMMQELGIIPANSTITVTLLAAWTAWPIDAIGYQAWLKPSSDGPLKMTLYFNTEWLTPDLSKPFEWLYDN